MEDLAAIIVLILISVLNILICNIYSKLAKQQKEIIEEQEFIIGEMYENSKVLTRYSLSRILVDAINKEDYETANNCKKILDKIENIGA